MRRIPEWSMCLLYKFLNRTIQVITICVVTTASIAHAATVTHLFTQTVTATGSGASGTPSIASFNIPSGKNRVLFIWATFERDHCSPADGTGGLCVSGNIAGTGLGDNWPEPRTGTPPATTTNNQITARVIGPGGTINRQNALVIGGTPSGDTRFITISISPSGSPSGTAFFSLGSFHIVLFENDINTLLGGAPSGTVSISLPDVNIPTNAGDDAMLSASVFQNVEQTVNGFVRNATATAQVITGTPGNFNLAPAAYDAGQSPDEADDGKLVMGANSTTEGFATPTGHTALATMSTTNNSGTYDTPNGNVNNEPNGVFGGAYFRNGGTTPGSLYTLTSAAPATTLVYGGTTASFLLESDNADVADAPVSYGNPTHTISGIRLGASVDADASLLNNSTATGDDSNGSDDEDGVTLVPLLPIGQTTIVPVGIQNASGFLNAWFDWNADGDFNDAGEQMVTNQAVSVGTVNLSVVVPDGAVIGPTFARFRVCTNNTVVDNCSSPTNTVQSGEVEDYQFQVGRTLTLRKTTIGAVGGPFGFTLTNTVQTTGSVTTTAVATPTQVDGDTGTAGTQVFTISSPTTAVTINENSLPTAWTLNGATCVNASGTTVGSLSGSTYTITGAEIVASISFTCTFTNQPSIDYGDAPDTGAGTGVGNYRTTLSDGGPSHVVVAGLRLGTNIDADSGSLQNAAADADDTTGTPDDEDGVASFTALTTASAQTYTVSTSVTNSTGSNAYLVGYIDFNKDGDFLDTGEQSSTVTITTSATNPRSFNVSFTTPAGMTAGTTYARFRISSTQAQAESSVGAASSGEVEDYQLPIYNPMTSITPTVGVCTIPSTDRFAYVNWPTGGTYVSGNSYPFTTNISGYDNSVNYTRLSGTYNPTTLPNTYVGNYAFSSAAGPLSNSNIEYTDINFAGQPGIDGEVRYDFDKPLSTSDGVLVWDVDNGETVSLTFFNSSGTQLSTVNWTGSMIKVAGTASVANLGNAILLDGSASANDTDPIWLFLPEPGQQVKRMVVTQLTPSLGGSYDFAFVHGDCQKDYGDAPASYDTGTAANHKVPATPTVYLGSVAPDYEASPLTPLNGTGDDSTGTPDDEDGVASFPSLTTASGASYTVSVNVTTTGTSYLRGFIDFNRDGDFADTGEQSATITVTASGSQSVSFTTPTGMTAGTTYARFRLSSTSSEVTSATGAATSGEVEDYQLTITSLSLSGKVFEDVNYGGGSGRDFSTSAGVGRPGVRVELYNSSGAYVGFTFTNVSGDYSFTGLAAGNYTVRVVNSFVTSSRTGGCTPSADGINMAACTQMAVQTFRTNGLTSNVGTPDTERVGGENPALVDAAANTTSATLASLTTATTTPQSITPITLSANTTGIDFGFNFDTIVSTRDSGQGSLRQFIINSNALGNTGLAQVGQTAGKEVSIFMISDGVAHPGLRAGLTNQLTTSGANSGAAVIVVTSALPSITDSNTTLDGSTQTTHVGNTKAGSVGTGGTVGVDGLTLSLVPQPEIAIDFRGLASNISGITVQAARFTARNMALFGVQTNFSIRTGLIQINTPSNTDRATLSQLLLGPAADGTQVSGGSLAIGVLAHKGAFDLTNSFIAFNGQGVEILPLASSSSNANLIENNEFSYNGASNTGVAWDHIGIQVNFASASSTANIVRGNYFHDSILGTVWNTQDAAIELIGFNSQATITNNTIERMGTAGISLYEGTHDNIVSKNIIRSTVVETTGPNTGAGIVSKAYSGKVPLRNRISQNSLYGNGGPGIDLHLSSSTSIGDGVTANDGVVNASQPNNGMDYPIITSASLSSGTLTVSGFVGNNPAGSATFAGATLEFFIADNSPANQNGEVIVGDGRNTPHGEGRTYLGSCTANSNSLFGCSFSSAGSLGLTSATNITATATDSNGNTSEFGAVLLLDYGDAPDTGAGTGVGNYQTTSGDSGPSHVVVAGLRLGANIDIDNGSLQNAAADADDTTGTPDDEDAVASFPTLSTASGVSYTVSVNVTTTGTSYVRGFIDFNRDGDFADTGESSSTITVSSSGAQNVSFTTPSGMTAGTTYARFRLSSISSEVTSATGAATSGEVEDYQLTISDNAKLGIAKAFDRIIPDSNAATSHEYTLVYRLTLENFGNVALSNLEIFDDVLSQFSGLNPRNYNAWVMANAGLLSPAATLTLNGSWNGSAASNILSSGQSLAVGATGIVYISFVVTVDPTAASPNNRLRDNSATANGTSPASTVVSDTSTNGTDPDGTDGDNNPDESEVTPASFVKLVKDVRNCGSSLSSCSGSYVTSETGKPEDYLEYRIRYYNISSQAISALRVSDTLVSETPFQEDTYSSTDDFSVVCPNNSVITLDRGDAAVSTTPAVGPITAFDVDIMAASACNLGGVLAGESGYLLFKVVIP